MLKVAKIFFGGILVLVFGAVFTTSLMDSKSSNLPRLDGGARTIIEETVATTNATPEINESYVRYEALSEEEKAKVDLIPKKYVLVVNDVSELKGVSNDITDTVELSYPAQYNVSNLNGGSYITPMKDQGGMGICWAFASVEAVESLVMTATNTPFNSNTVILSPRQMDYAISTDGIFDYENGNGYRELTQGGNFYMSSLAMANGVTLMRESDFPFNERTDKKNLADVFNYNNSVYEVTETVMIPNITNRSLFVEAVKSFLIENGSAYVGTGSPQGACAAKNGDGTVFVEEEALCIQNTDEDNGYGGHAMQIVGWNDDYSYSYCKLSNKTHQSLKNGSCTSGTRVDGTGAWLVRNSWGENATYKYIYLTYDSLTIDVDFVTGVAAMEGRSWDNNYHENVYEDIDNITDGNYASSTFTKKISSDEKIESIKFMTLSMNGDFTVSISGYDGTITMHAAWPGIHTIDISSLGIILPDDEFTVTVTGSNERDSVLGKTISVFTSNVSKTPEMKTADIDGGVDALESSDFVRTVYSDTKNIPSGTVITYTLEKDGEDVSSYLSYMNSTVAINNVNVKITIDKDAEYGEYTLVAHYGNNRFESKISLPSSMTVSFNSTVASEKDEKYLLVKNADFEKLTNSITATSGTPEYLHYNKNMSLATDGLLRTGDYLVVNLSDKVKYKYAIVVPGDIDGDGQIMALDYVGIKNHIMDVKTIGKGAYYYAADVDMDDRIMALDYVRIKNYIMGERDL